MCDGGDGGGDVGSQDYNVGQDVGYGYDAGYGTGGDANYGYGDVPSAGASVSPGGLDFGATNVQFTDPYDPTTLSDIGYADEYGNFVPVADESLIPDGRGIALGRRGLSMSKAATLVDQFGRQSAAGRSIDKGANFVARGATNMLAPFPANYFADQALQNASPQLGGTPRDPESGADSFDSNEPLRRLVREVPTPAPEAAPSAQQTAAPTVASQAPKPKPEPTPVETIVIPSPFEQKEMSAAEKDSLQALRRLRKQAIASRAPAEASVAAEVPMPSLYEAPTSAAERVTGSARRKTRKLPQPF